MCTRKNVNYITGLAVIFFVSLLIAVVIGTGAFLLGIMMILSLFFIIGPPAESIYYFTLLTIFQNIILVVFAPYLNSTETVGIILAKEMVVYIVAAVYFAQNRIARLKKRDWLFVCFVVLVGMNVLASNSFRFGMVALRQIALIFLCYYFGKSIKVTSEESLKKYFNFILFICLFVCILGLVFFGFSDNDWVRIGFAKYWENKTNGQTSYNFINFYTFDLGVRLKRIVSVFVEPLACAHFLGIGFVTVFITKKGNYALKMLITACLIMGLSKGSLVLLMSMVVVTIYSRIKSNRLRRFFIITCTFCGLVIIAFLTSYSNGLARPTAIGNHFNAFLYGVKNATIFGKGLGTTGYNAKIMGLVDFDSGYNESFFSMCIGQLGLLGTSFIYIFLIMCISENFKIYILTKNRYVFISVILLFSVTVESLFSASSISMLGTGLYFVIAGLCSNASREVKYDL